MKARWALVAALLAGLVVLPGLTLGLAVVATLGGAVAGGGCGGDGGVGGGSQQIGGRVWSAEQATNAHTLVAGAAARGLPKRAAVVAVSAAVAESGLRNHPERGLLGPTGDRPPQASPPASTRAGGSVLLNPGAATESFYSALVTVPGWARLAPGTAAAAVQGSGDPTRYAVQEAAAAALVDRFWPAAGPPVPPVPPAPGDAPADAAGRLVPPACPDPGGSDAPGGPLDRSRVPADVGLPTDPARRAAVQFALAQVGRPYVFGAKGPNAFDCSGLTQAAWAAAGVGISAGTVTQIHDGAPVSSLADLAPGDLLFSAGSLGTTSRPRHVGLYAGEGVVVEAASRRTGVITSSLERWKDKTVAIRRITGPAPDPGAAPPPTPPPAPRPGPPRSALAAAAGAPGR